LLCYWFRVGVVVAVVIVRLPFVGKHGSKKPIRVFYSDLACSLNTVAFECSHIRGKGIRYSYSRGCVSEIRKCRFPVWDALAFTRYCHCQYCTVHGIHKWGRWVFVYFPIAVQKYCNSVGNTGRPEE